jgi:hypothetical protein
MSTFGWCQANQHDICRRKYQRFVFDVRRGKSILVYLDEWRECQCKKRGCPCYVPAKSRNKSGKKRKRKS